MNDMNLMELLLPEEQAALEELADGLLVDINARLSRIIRLLGLKKSLSCFKIGVAGLQITVNIDEETREYLLERKGDVEGSNSSNSPNYYA